MRDETNETVVDQPVEVAAEQAETTTEEVETTEE